MVPESEGSSSGEEEEEEVDEFMASFKSGSPLQMRPCCPPMHHDPLEDIPEDGRSGSSGKVSCCSDNDCSDQENGEVNEAFAKDDEASRYLVMNGSSSSAAAPEEEEEILLVSTGLKEQMMDVLEKRLGSTEDEMSEKNFAQPQPPSILFSEFNSVTTAAVAGDSNHSGPQLRNVKLKPAVKSSLAVSKPIAVELNADPEHNKRSSFYTEIIQEDATAATKSSSDACARGGENNEEEII